MVKSSFPLDAGLQERVAADLRDAVRAGKPWFELARTMESAFGPRIEQPAVAAALGRAAGIAPAVAKRYARLLAKIRDISKEMGATEDGLLVSAFNSQEIAVRIYERDKVEGGDVLRRLAKGEITLPRLREIQARKPASPSVSLRSSIAHQRTVGAYTVELALRNDGVRLFGEGFRSRRRPKLQFVGNLGYEVIGADGAIVAGVDVLFPDARMGHDALDRHLNRSLALAPFFPKFFVAFPTTADIGNIPAGDSSRQAGFERDLVARTVELLEWLRFGWIGVMVAIDDDTLKVIRPSQGDPVPDMTARYDSFVRRFASATTDNPDRKRATGS